MLKKFSGKNVVKAGDLFLTDDIYQDKVGYDWAMSVLSYWRSSHEESLELAFSLTQKITRKIDVKAVYAKRLKRTPSIVRKLRFVSKDNMKLKTMHDIGGCRIIVTSTKALYKVIAELKKQPEFLKEGGGVRCRDYLSTAKKTGYRSYHLIGKFKNSTGQLRLIEIQVRTKLQHDWATTLEIVELFTGQALKSNGGDVVWRLFFKGISEILTNMERIPKFTRLSEVDKYSQFTHYVSQRPKLLESCTQVVSMSRTISAHQMLHSFTESLKFSHEILKQKPETSYMLLQINLSDMELTCTDFKQEQVTLAEQEYTKAEKKFLDSPQNVTVALIYSDAIGGIREAFPNYFADSHEFLGYLALISTVAMELKTAALHEGIFVNQNLALPKGLQVLSE
jgi:ppGpp synthetase/RelA/SpoT-type nucleotidyltranferase